MKSALLSMVTLAALASVQAASVEGNNTAVVIRRANVASASGHHLLCVPVAPLSISGSAEGGIPLETLLPASLYSGAKVTLNAESEDAKTYTAEENGWTIVGAGGTVASNEGESMEPMLTPKQVIWLENPADKEKAEGAREKPIVFCGAQNDDMDKISIDVETLQSTGNATSTVKHLSDFLPEDFETAFGKGTQILSIAGSGDKEYTRYYYYGKNTGWKKFMPTDILTVDITKVEIQPGEAVYYFAKKPKEVASAK